MSLSKSKCWYSNNCLHFVKCAVPLTVTLLVLNSNGLADSSMRQNPTPVGPATDVYTRSREPLLKGKGLSTVDLLVLTILDQLLLILQFFLQNELS